MRHSVGGRDALDGLERGTEEEIARFVTASVAENADALKGDWRAQIEAARLGSRLAKTIRSRVYPPGQPSVDAAAMVWTKAPKIVGAYASGATIVARNGSRFLAIPTPDTPRKRQGNALTPAEVEARFGRPLQFISPRDGGFWSPSQRRNGVAFLVLKNLRVRKATGRWRNASASELKRRKETSAVIMFILVPRVRVTKRLDLEALGKAAEARYPGLLSKNWR